MFGYPLIQTAAEIKAKRLPPPPGGICPYCWACFNHFGQYKAHKRCCKSKWAFKRSLQYKDLAVATVVRVRGNKNAARKLVMECKTLTGEDRQWVMRHIAEMPTEGLWS